jgi:hypothetical protein
MSERKWPTRTLTMQLPLETQMRSSPPGSL